MFPYVETLKMGSTAGDGRAVAPPQPSRSRCRNRISAAFVPCSGVSEFRKLNLQIGECAEGSHYESHLSEVTGLGGAATREHPESNGSNC